MLEEVIGSSPTNAGSSIHKRRLLRKNKHRTKTETSQSRSATVLETSMLENLYDEDDNTTSKILDIDNFDPFEEQYLLLAADCAFMRENHNGASCSRMPASQGFQRLDEFNVLNELQDTSKVTRTPARQQELRLAITDTELFDFCEEAEKQAVGEEKEEVDTPAEEQIKFTLDATLTATAIKSKSIVDSILEDFCCSPCSPEKKDPQSYEDFTPTFMFRNKTLRTYVNSSNRKPKLCSNLEKRIEEVCLPQPILAPARDDDDCHSNCSSILSVQEDLSLITSDPKGDALKDSDRVCGNMLNLSAYFSQLSGEPINIEEVKQEVQEITDDRRIQSITESSTDNVKEEVNKAIVEPQEIVHRNGQAEKDMNASYLSNLCDTILTYVDSVLHVDISNDVKDEVVSNASSQTNQYLLNEKDTHSVNLSPTTFTLPKEGNLFTEADEKDWNEDSEFFMHFRTQHVVDEVITVVHSKDSPANMNLKNAHSETLTPQQSQQDSASRVQISKDSVPAINETNEQCLFETNEDNLSTTMKPALIKVQNDCDSYCKANNVPSKVALFSEESNDFVDDGDFFMNFRTQDVCDKANVASTSKAAMMNFQTASKKSIIISNEAQKRAAQFLHDVTEAENMQHMGQDIVEDTKNEQRIQKKPYQDPTCSNELNAFVQPEDFENAISEAAQLKLNNVLAEFPELQTQLNRSFKESTNSSQLCALKAQTTEDINNAEDYENIQFSEWLLEPSAPNAAADGTNQIVEGFGFRTASSKTIKISEEAANRAQSILAAVAIEDYTETSSTKIAENFEGFRTASEKSIQISEKAARHAQSILETVTAEDLASSKAIKISNAVTKQEYYTETITPYKQQAFQGFTTASSKSIKISAAAAQRAQSILATIVAEDCEEENFKGFRTASEKPIQVSQEAKRQAESILSIVEVDGTSLPAPSLTRKENFQGFRTASEKSIQISVAAARRAETILAAVTSTDAEDFDVSQASVAKNFDSFRTASSKSIRISEEATKRAKNILAELDSSTKASTKELMKADEVHNENLQQSSSTSSPVKNLETLKTKSILTDLSNLDMAKQHLIKQDALKLHAVVLKKESAKEQILMMDQQSEPGFHTANQKPIAISAAAKQHVVGILAELERETEICSKSEKLYSKTLNSKATGGSTPPRHTEANESSSGDDSDFMGFDEDASKHMENLNAIALTASQILAAKFALFATNEENVGYTAVKRSRRSSNSAIGNSTASDERIRIKRRFSKDETIDSPKCFTRSQTLGSLSQARSPLIRKENSSIDAKLNDMAVLAPLKLSATATIIARKNLLSLSKRKKGRSSNSPSAGDKEETVELATETPIKQRNSTLCNVASSDLTPGTPNLREFFNAATGTSTPAQPQEKKAHQETSCAANFDDDFKQIKWDTPGKGVPRTLNHSSAVSANVTLCRSNSKLSDTSFDNVTVTESNPSPKQRIERLRMYGEVPAISPVAMQVVKNCRPSGLRRGKSFKQ